MNLDEAYARILDDMDVAQSAGLPCDWKGCLRLIEQALAILDASGRGHIAAARSLSDALVSVQQECAGREPIEQAYTGVGLEAAAILVN